MLVDQSNVTMKPHVLPESPLSTQWLEIFHTGDFGDRGSFNESDLDQIVRNFDPSFHEPPAVIGHPTHDAPAYGWVDGLKRRGGVLLGKLKQVDPSFEKMVKAGQFKKRSIALYKTANGLMLRHIGFLGAQPPSVKDLANATFSEDRIDFTTLAFEESESHSGTAVARLKDGGYWMPDFDRFNFPAIFAELENSPALPIFERFLERLQDDCGFDPGSARLSQRARNFMRFHGVSFDEALDQIQHR